MVEKIKNLIVRGLLFFAVSEIGLLGIVLIMFKVYGWILVTFVNPKICIRFGYKEGFFIIWLIAVFSIYIFILIHDHFKKDIFKIHRLKSKLSGMKPIYRITISILITFVTFIFFPTGFVIFIRKGLSFDRFQKKCWIFILMITSNIPTALLATAIAYGLVDVLKLF